MVLLSLSHVLHLGCAQPWVQGTRACQWPGADNLPAPSLGTTSLPPAHKREKLGPLGFGRGRGHRRGKHPAEPPPGPTALQSCLLGQGGAGTESPALGAHPFLRCVPLGLQDLRSCIHVLTHAAQPVSGPLCVYTCDYNVIVQIPRRPSVCVRAQSACALCVCFKSPLGGNSFFFLPFLFGCDLGEIDGQPVRWMLTVSLIYRVTYAK